MKEMAPVCPFELARLRRMAVVGARFVSCGGGHRMISRDFCDCQAGYALVQGGFGGTVHAHDCDAAHILGLKREPA